MQQTLNIYATESVILYRKAVLVTKSQQSYKGNF